jgi:hypothetical protein
VPPSGQAGALTAPNHAPTWHALTRSNRLPLSAIIR